MSYEDMTKIDFLTEFSELHIDKSLMNEQLEIIFNVNPIIMAVSTIREGKFIKVNKAWLDTLEYTYDEVIGRSSQELNIFIDFQERQRVGQQILADGVVRNQEIKIRTKTGRILTGLFSGDIITLGGENFFLTTAVDITKKKQMEHELERMERLNLLGQMAASIGHEVRNPLCAVYGLLQLLMNKDGCSQYKKEFELMLSELLRANSIIEEFLSLGRDKPQKVDKHNLNNIIQRLYPLISSDAISTDKIVKLELDNIPDMLLDEGEIRQLILNMVRNGLESMKPGKHMIIKTFSQENEIVLLFKDHGEGIPLDIINKIGTPFFSTKENGTGLGLAACFKIAERHNGYIRIDSGTYGTTFLVHFRV